MASSIIRIFISFDYNETGRFVLKVIALYHKKNSISNFHFPRMGSEKSFLEKKVAPKDYFTYFAHFKLIFIAAMIIVYLLYGIILYLHIDFHRFNNKAQIYAYIMFLQSFNTIH